MDVHARLAAWREQGTDRIDPLRFALMDAMARRALRHDGQVRKQLDARLQELADAYAGLLADQPEATPPHHADESPMQQLLAQFANAPRLDGVPQAVPMARTRDEAPIADIAPMPALDEFQQLWSRIRIDSLLRQCLDSLPEDAGPLHSRVLAYRAMTLMRDVSPEYLQHFVAYADVLTWMEHAAGRAVAGGDADGAASVRKPARAGGSRRKKPATTPPAQP
ncbi:MAG: hypothetical protein BGP10_07425 [Rhodanobacter sp. 68-29]|nr:DUF2894 domain-containing protein [Rhodanobacter sp.]ODU75565.1 MAG: hypothetical protein ABT17_02260 [Rhodanobacter sp. SCN 69-32]OJY56853.1 MAG: hypothetical protein BGP10_07425 [Rhodanobacter sp. 68-29]